MAKKKTKKKTKKKSVKKTARKAPKKTKKKTAKKASKKKAAEKRVDTITDKTQAIRPPAGPDGFLIEEIKSLLTRAMKGEVIGFATVCTLADGTTYYASKGMINYPVTIGQFELLKLSLLEQWRAAPG